LGLLVQVDTLCHKIPNFIEKCKRAGVTRVFIGLENINPDNLLAAKKRQNKITEYRKMLLAWKDQGIMTLAGYILGFPGDTPESIRKDIEILKRELPLDIVEFFCLTPLPGSEDHQALWKSGIAMDPDLNNYDLEHVCTAHSRMSHREWESIYREAWSIYYSPDHMEVLLRRAAATGIKMSSLVKLLYQFSTMQLLEGVHPLQSGVFRLRHLDERRPELPRENPILFRIRLAADLVRKTWFALTTLARLSFMALRITRDPKRFEYMDEAMTRVTDDEEFTLDLLTQTQGAKQAVAHQKKVFSLTHGRA
jgi:hypothetical protein